MTGTPRPRLVLLTAAALLAAATPACLAASPEKGTTYHDRLRGVDLEVSASGRTLRALVRCQGRFSRTARGVRIARGGRFAYTGRVRAGRRRVGMRLRGSFTRSSVARGTVRLGRCRARFTALPDLAPPLTSGGAARADYNGDGFSDLAMGVPDEDVGDVYDAGAVLVAYGSDVGLHTTGAQLLHLGTAGIPGPPRASHGFGRAVAGGDFNLDGHSDLAVTTSYPQSLYVIYGSARGLGTSLPQVWAPDRLGLHTPDVYTGWSLVWGEFGRGAAADLAIGSTPKDTTGQDFGQVAVLYGSPSGGLGVQGPQVLTEQKVWYFSYERHREGDGFGTVLAAGHLGRTGEHELVIGAPGYDAAGAAFVFYGSPEGLGEGRYLAGVSEFREDTPYDLGPAFGSALAIGDFDADGIGDLAAGAPHANYYDSERRERHIDAGAVRVHRGTTAGVSEASTTLRQGKPEFGDLFGRELAAGDFDGDGRRDLAVGAPDEHLTATENGGTAAGAAGAVSVFGGSPSGLSAASRQFLVQGREGLFGTAEVADRFGSVLTAWNWGRGGAADLAIGVPSEALGTTLYAGVVQILYGATGGVGFGGQQLFDQGAFGLSVEAGDSFGSALY
jgi:hypothetical protein